MSSTTDLSADELAAVLEQRLRLALEASQMGTWDYDVPGDSLAVSDEVTALVGRPLSGHGAAWRNLLEQIHPDDRLAVERAVRAALASGDELEVQARLTTGSAGGVRWVLAKARLVRDGHGRALRMTGVAMDITDRKEAEMTRHQMAHGARLRALGEMASGIAHDLNQSLALITGYSDMVRHELRLGTPDLERVREMVEITGRAALDGGKALRGLLTFVRTQSTIAELERVDLAEILNDAARLTAPRWRDAPQAEGRPIELVIRRADPNSWINGSASELREAITNLIFNAVDALPRGGRIELVAGRQGEQVLVEVSDTGTGMTPAVRERVFELFYTTKGEQGTGLGLPQVLGTVERHGGTLDLDSAPGRGTTFRLWFPRASAPPATPGDAAAPSVERAPARFIRVLIVEDEARLATMSRHVMTQQGHHVVVARNGDEAVERLDEARFELVISDLGLGAGKNGWDLAQYVRERWPSTRFVLVTGWGAAIDPREAAARGVQQVIAKPYRIADLRQIADDVAATVAGD